MSATAFPLQWPPERKRSTRRQDSSFRLTFGAARDDLFAEIRRLGARHVVISSNVPLRLDGKPYANTPRLDDPGVAAYFEHRGRSMCFACDRWTKVEDNMRAIGKTVEALRGIARWGTGDMLEAAFRGFEALPAPTATRDWWTVLGVRATASGLEITEAYRRRRSETHPDKGGTLTAFDEVEQAYRKATA